MISSYNVLADSLVYQERNRYPRSTALELSWEFRSVGLLNEIRRWNPSVLCLQEVDRRHFESFFQPKLAEFGYSAGVYQERTVSKSVAPHAATRSTDTVPPHESRAKP